MSNCYSSTPCQTDSSSVIYTSGNLSCVGINTNDTLSFALFKLNQKICDLQAQLNECCSSQTTTTTTTTSSCNNPVLNVFNDYLPSGPQVCVNPGDDLLDIVFSSGDVTTSSTTTLF